MLRKLFCHKLSLLDSNRPRRWRWRLCRAKRFGFISFPVPEQRKRQETGYNGSQEVGVMNRTVGVAGSNKD